MIQTLCPALTVHGVWCRSLTTHVHTPSHGRPDERRWEAWEADGGEAVLAAGLLLFDDTAKRPAQPMARAAAGRCDLSQGEEPSVLCRAMVTAGVALSYS